MVSSFVSMEDEEEIISPKKVFTFEDYKVIKNIISIKDKYRFYNALGSG